MKLWVGRHLDAGDHVRDPVSERTRGLTSASKVTGRALAEVLAGQDVQPKVILASTYARTQQTADIYGTRLGIDVDLLDQVNPRMPLNVMIAALLNNAASRRVFIVGHSDNIDSLFGDESTGDMGDCLREGEDDQQWPPMVKGEIRRLSIDRDSGEWACMWRLTPSDIGFQDMT